MKLFGGAEELPLWWLKVCLAAEFVAWIEVWVFLQLEPPAEPSLRHPLEQEGNGLVVLVLVLVV